MLILDLKKTDSPETKPQKEKNLIKINQATNQKTNNQTPACDAGFFIFILTHTDIWFASL